MCRLMVYMGTPILVDQLLYQPKNSLINQSINAKELEEPLNGDGFGIGWYVSDAGYQPVTFVSVYPAWNNRNLKNLAPKIKTECLVAHVRAASVGDVSESNCHPFQYKNFLMMHNGGIENFGRIKRKLRSELTDELYNWIKGQTDSEHIFAYLLHEINRSGPDPGPEEVIQAFEKTFSHVKFLMQEANIQEPGYFNMVITNGVFAVGTRFVSQPNLEPLSLYHSMGSRYVCEEGICRMISPDEQNNSVLVVSEKLTDQRQDWHVIPPNHFVIVDSSLKVNVRPIQA